MRRITTGIALTASLVLAGCGSSSSHFANKPRPPSPVNLTVYINDQRVSVSPSKVGAGPVVFIVTNQASKAVSLAILPAGVSAAQPLADTGPISPQATAQVTVDFNQPGNFVVSGISGSTQASEALPSGIAPAVLHIGKSRPSASSQLLSP